MVAIYLETSALRKITDYKCEQDVFTSIFSVFELLAGINEKEYNVRKACITRICEQKIKIKTPMVDEFLNRLLGLDDYNKFACQMICDVSEKLIKSKKFSEFQRGRLFVTDINNMTQKIVPLEWLKNWDNNISSIKDSIPKMFQDENREYIRKIYKERGEKGLAEHFWTKYFENRTNYELLNHAEPFIGLSEKERIIARNDQLFSKYNYKLFLTAQAVVFSISYFIDCSEPDKNNSSDLLHLLYLNETDTFVSNDNIYLTISKACENFKPIIMNNETSLSKLLNSQTSQILN